MRRSTSGHFCFINPSISFIQDFPPWPMLNSSTTKYLIERSQSRWSSMVSGGRVAKSDLNSTEAYFVTKNQHQKHRYSTHISAASATFCISVWWHSLWKKCYRAVDIRSELMLYLGVAKAESNLGHRKN